MSFFQTAGLWSPVPSHPPSVQTREDARFEKLEAQLFEQAERVTALERHITDLSKAIDEFQGMQEQLCDCVMMRSPGGIVAMKKKLAKQRAGVLMRNALQQSEILRIVTVGAGLASAYRITTLSNSLYDGVRGVFPEIVKAYAPVPICLGGFEGQVSSAAKSVHYFDPARERWEVLLPMRTGKIGCAVAFVGGKLYVFGGCNASLEDLNQAECFDPVSGLWEELPPMPASRRLCTAAELHGKAYVFGRGVSLSESAIGFCFNPKEVSWQALPAMPPTLVPCVAVAMKEKVYLFSSAGHGREALRTADVFNPSTGRWDGLPSIPTPRRSFAAAGLGSYIYICGGFSPSSEPKPLSIVERFDVNNRCWETLPRMMSPRGCCAAGMVRGQLYVFGGSADEVEPLAVAERFTPGVMTWEALPKMRNASLLCATLAVDGMLIAGSRRRCVVTV